MFARSSCCGTAEATSNHEITGSIPGLAPWVKDLSCGIGCRRGLDPGLLWLWCRLAVVAPIQPLAWEPPYALKGLKKKKKNLVFARNGGCCVVCVYSGSVGNPALL